MACGRGEGDEALKLGSNPGLCSWDGLAWCLRQGYTLSKGSFLSLPLAPEKSKAMKLVSSEQREKRRFTTFLSPLTIWISFFFNFLSFSPWGLEEVGYFILIMAAAAAACEPKNQLSDQKEKHIHIPTDKLSQSINYTREGQLLPRAHGWGWAWRNLGCPARDTQIQAEIPRGASPRLPSHLASFLPPGSTPRPWATGQHKGMFHVQQLCTFNAHGGNKGSRLFSVAFLWISH